MVGYGSVRLGSVRLGSVRFGSVRWEKERDGRGREGGVEWRDVVGVGLGRRGTGCGGD